MVICVVPAKAPYPRIERSRLAIHFTIDSSLRAQDIRARVPQNPTQNDPRKIIELMLSDLEGQWPTVTRLDLKNERNYASGQGFPVLW